MAHCPCYSNVLKNINVWMWNCFVQVKLGEAAPNSKVVKVAGINRRWSISGKTHNKCHLLDFESPDRPLVVNFGSATWPPFISQLPVFRRMVEEFSDVADFLLVYIDEAHPSDGWAAPPMDNFSFEVRKHRNLEERMFAARTLLEHFSLPPQCQLVADCMDNNANAAYGVAYERVCIVQKKKIAYLGGKGPFFYNLKNVRHWLEKSYGKR